ncbi:MAG: T9SS type A sorting domain-containing protein, partial [Bacteroidia bacterium]|nr:T9SS type A sorting domain-containing protein [Bacteroidia bacterium]
YMLQNAATRNLEVEATMDGYQVEDEIINETGHKLPSGYPEGRRIWINLKAFDIADNLLFESGAYDSSTGTLNLVNTKIYEAKLGMSQNVADIANANGTGTYSAGESFHFALNNMVIKDNRIPPRGFTNANFEAVQAAPVGYSYADGDYSDETYYTVPEDTYRIEVKLFYQTTSKEYIEFLRDENVTDTKGQELYDLWVAFGRSAPELMVEQEFFTDLLDIENAQITDKSIRLYPSPAADEIFLSMPEGRMLQQMILYNVSGQLIRQSKSSPMMVSDISPGLYLMEIITDKGKTTRKILIK